MPAKFHDFAVVFGIKPEKEIRGIPEGAKVRIKMRTGSIAVCYVRDGKTFSAHRIMEKTTHWELGAPFAINRRK